jgi:hypothetical protein
MPQAIWQIVRRGRLANGHDQGFPLSKEGLLLSAAFSRPYRLWRQDKQANLTLIQEFVFLQEKVIDVAMNVIDPSADPNSAQREMDARCGCIVCRCVDYIYLSTARCCEAKGWA